MFFDFPDRLEFAVTILVSRRIILFPSARTRSNLLRQLPDGNGIILRLKQNVILRKVNNFPYTA